MEYHLTGSLWRGKLWIWLGGSVVSGAAGVCCRRELLVPEKAFVFHDFVHSRLTANDL